MSNDESTNETDKNNNKKNFKNQLEEKIKNILGKTKSYISNQWVMFKQTKRFFDYEKRTTNHIISHDYYRRMDIFFRIVYK